MRDCRDCMNAQVRLVDALDCSSGSRALWKLKAKHQAGPVRCTEGGFEQTYSSVLSFMKRPRTQAEYCPRFVRDDLDTALAPLSVSTAAVAE
jgi:hypothetical protein